MTVGRRVEADVALGWDTEVSRLHAVLEYVAGEWTVVDDGLSQNGTFIGTVRVSGRQRLRDGDVLRVGRTRVAFRNPVRSGSRPTAAASPTRRRRAHLRRAEARAGRALPAVTPTATAYAARRRTSRSPTSCSCPSTPSRPTCARCSRSSRSASAAQPQARGAGRAGARRGIVSERDLRVPAQ